MIPDMHNHKMTSKFTRILSNQNVSTNYHQKIALLQPCLMQKQKMKLNTVPNWDLAVPFWNRMRNSKRKKGKHFHGSILAPQNRKINSKGLNNCVSFRKKHMDLEQRRLTHANLISMTPAPKLNLKKRTCGISSNVAIAMQHNPDNILHWQQSSPLRLHSIQRDQLMMFLLVGLQRPILSPFNRNELMTNAFVGNVNWRTYALLACHESSSFVFFLCCGRYRSEATLG